MEKVEELGFELTTLRLQVLCFTSGPHDPFSLYMIKVLLGPKYQALSSRVFNFALAQKCAKSAKINVTRKFPLLQDIAFTTQTKMDKQFSNSIF